MRLSDRLKTNIKTFLLTGFFCTNCSYFVYQANGQPDVRPPATKTTGYPSLGNTPGDPANGRRALENIYKYVQIYRNGHDGQYPSSITEILGTALKATHAQDKQGFKDTERLFVNPDSQYADSPMLRRNYNDIIPYIVTNKRLDGISVGSAKLAGTKDLLASTDIYYHLNSSSSNGKNSINPVGFFLVLWDDGKIDQVPFDQALYLYNSKNGVRTSTRLFPSQAGELPVIVTYEELAILRYSTENIIGKPIVGAREEPIVDNGGPESLIRLSRLLSYPSHYGIEREKLWQIFSAAQEEYTLHEVQTGAQKLGLPLQLRKLSLAELEQLNVPALFLTTDDKRIVTISTVDDNEAIVIDRGLTRIVSRETLFQKYGGEALVSQATEVASRIIAEDPVRILTVQNKDEELTQQVTVTNRGTQPLTLQIERPIPGVVKAELSGDIIAPGQSTTLSLSMKWREILKGDTQNIFVLLKTNDPLRPRLQLGFQLRALQPAKP